jgi:hypothetical protein
MRKFTLPQSLKSIFTDYMDLIFIRSLLNHEGYSIHIAYFNTYNKNRHFFVFTNFEEYLECLESNKC